MGPAAEAAQLTAVRRGRLLRVDSGLAVLCPSRGPACAVRGFALAEGTRPLGRVDLTVPPGHRREIVFALTPAGARLLKKNHGSLIGGVLTTTARAGQGAAVGNILLPYSLTGPSR